jgi:amidohydrolase
MSERMQRIVSDAKEWRHHIHQNPELAYNEHKTAKFVAERLKEWGLKVHQGLAGTGVVGTLKRGSSGRVIGIRADMDALPIIEQTGVSYSSSSPGVMHACGHDGHVAMALAAARRCAEFDDLDGTVHFIFQPAEENEGGARRMINEGLFRQFPCDAIYALHNWPPLPVGTCSAREGPVMAALGIFEVTITGRGCHGALPHEGSDSILASCQLVSALHTIPSRDIDPQMSSVVSATQIHGGDTWNVIPAKCVIRGTTRWFDHAVGDILERRLKELATSISRSFGCDADIRYERRFPPTVNHPGASGFIREVASATGLKIIDASPSMTSEDFAVMLEEIPGCYFWLGGARVEGNFGLHSTRYDFNDESLPLGIDLWTEVVRESLGRNASVESTV